MSTVNEPSSWYLAYHLATYYFTFICSTIIDSIISSLTTHIIKERCLCPVVFNFLRFPLFLWFQLKQQISIIQFNLGFMDFHKSSTNNHAIHIFAEYLSSLYTNII